MGPPNTTWSQILAQAHANPEVLKQQEVIKSIQNVLQTNVSVCTSLGQPFLVQFNVIFADMLQVPCMHVSLVASEALCEAAFTFRVYVFMLWLLACIILVLTG